MKMMLIPEWNVLVNSGVHLRMNTILFVLNADQMTLKIGKVIQMKKTNSVPELPVQEQDGFNAIGFCIVLTVAAIVCGTAALIGLITRSFFKEDEVLLETAESTIQDPAPSAEPVFVIATPDVSYAFEVKENRQKAIKVINTYLSIKDKIDSLEIPVMKMKLTSLGNYYITGYSPYECGGSWTTASGATCHRSNYEDRLTIPTTCAIDPKLHDFGDLFYISYFDWVFVAEDTGSAVKGKHLDLFYPEYSDVVNFPTGYYEVFSVEYVYTSEQLSKYDVTNLIVERLGEYNG